MGAKDKEAGPSGLGEIRWMEEWEGGRQRRLLGRQLTEEVGAGCTGSAAAGGTESLAVSMPTVRRGLNRT